MKLINGDCLEVLKTFEDNSIDSIVTDPPYDINFNNEKWDNTNISTNVELWKELYRVVKPGGYLLSFTASRKYHRVASSIEDAGFEIRDMIEWIYTGLSMPKSQNVALMIDKLKGNKKSYKNINTLEEFNKIREDLVSDEAKKYRGTGTNLKPTHEPIVMARKPISEKTIAENVLKWGVGCIYIDDCRIEVNRDDMEILDKNRSSFVEYNSNKGMFCDCKKLLARTNIGRFPTNIILDGSDEVKEIFPSSKSAKSSLIRNNNYKDGKIIFNNSKFIRNLAYNDQGSNARFFYCAKPSAKEKNMGLDMNNKHVTIKPLKLMEYLIRLVTPKNGIVLDPFMGSGTTIIASINTNRDAIGIEKEQEYFNIAKKRINFSITKE
jgi:site-specific DNA-methyltransferase (adenine-specific)